MNLITYLLYNLYRFPIPMLMRYHQVLFDIAELLILNTLNNENKFLNSKHLFSGSGKKCEEACILNALIFLQERCIVAVFIKKNEETRKTPSCPFQFSLVKFIHPYQMQCILLFCFAISLLYQFIT